MDLEVKLDAKVWSDAFESAKKIFTYNRLRESQCIILQSATHSSLSEQNQSPDLWEV